MLGILTSDILKYHVRYFGSVMVMDIAEDSGSVDTIAVAEGDVTEGGGIGLGSDLQIPSPIAPCHTVLHRNMLHISIIPTANALQNNAIVEIPQKAVTNDGTATVEQVNAI